MACRRYCITWNNYPEDWWKILKSIPHAYVCGAKEVGESGTPHIQGYIELIKNSRFSAIHKFNTSDKAFALLICNGSADQNIAYCKGLVEKKGNVQNETFVEDGQPKIQGKRNDLKVVQTMLKQGKGMRDIVETDCNYQCIRYAELRIKYSERRRDWKPHVTWIWGKPGVGKTREAHWRCIEEPWVSGRNLKWWQNYDAHRCVIIDDFRADFCTYHELLRILDRYAYTVEVKGGSRQLLAEDMYITSCYPPDQVYETREDIGQLLRRIDEVLHMT